jgi:hypothetical protein
MIIKNIHPSPAEIYAEWVGVIFWSLVFLRVLVSKKPLPGLLAGPGRLLRFVLVLLTFGLLSGCSNPDPLAVASGPLFALNASQWQPTPQELAAPPAVADR